MYKSDDILIYASKPVNFLYVLLSLVFIVLGFLPFLGINLGGGKEGALFSIIFIVGGLILLPGFLMRLLNSEPEIVINKDGIQYYKYPHKKRFIRWNDVHYITEKSRKNTKYIQLVLKDKKDREEIKEIITKEPDLYEKGNSVSIVAFVFKGYNHKKLKGLLELKHGEHKKRNKI